MQLNKFTDYALRVLMYVSCDRETPYTIHEIAEQLQVSKHHLVKIVHFMGQQQWLLTSRGKGGGLRLNPAVYPFTLGQMVRILQNDQPIVNCQQPPCLFSSQCGLNPILNQAVNQFYQHLDQYTIADLVKLQNGLPRLQRMHNHGELPL